MAFLGSSLSWATGWRRRLLPLLASFLVLGAHARAVDRLPEYQVKAGYLYHFTKYIEWPADAFPDAAAPILLGVLGEDPFGEVLEQTVQGRLSQNRKLVVRRARAVEDLQGCQLVFIGASEAPLAAVIFAALRDAPVVTVCDLASIFEEGAMLHLTLVDQTVQFEVRLEPATRARLRFNSRMLAAARRVWRDPSPARRSP